MTETDTTQSSVKHWDAFWRARDKSAQPEDPGASDRAPARFWTSLFEMEFAGREDVRLIDVASGHGAVTAIAIDAAATTNTHLYANCVDYSKSAIEEVCRRFPQVQGVACDSSLIPYSDRAFDLVVSQFGIEYSGEHAFEEAARLVDANGVFAALVHLQGGAIHEECADNVAVIHALNETRFLPLARAAFAAGFDLIAGKLTDPEFQEFDKELAPAVELAKGILAEKGSRAAGGLLARVYRDIAYMYSRMQNYRSDDVFAWFDGIADELRSYEGRMVSMTQCALDDSDIASVVTGIARRGFKVEPPEVLALSKNGRPGAWILVARLSR